jgi:hypothetical protein
MTRDEATAIVATGLGFRTDQNTNIYLALQEAQRELELGKTLPKFLIQEDAALVLASGAFSVNLPTGFIREVDDDGLRYSATGNPPTDLVFLQRKRFKEALLGNAIVSGSGEARAPSIYVIRKATINFVTVADRTYNLSWSYYKNDTVISTSVNGTNGWLTNAPDWLLNEAGWRLAMALRNQSAIQLFDTKRNRARAAFFGEQIVSEEAGGPIAMGEGL